MKRRFQSSREFEKITQKIPLVRRKIVPCLRRNEDVPSPRESVFVETENLPYSPFEKIPLHRRSEPPAHRHAQAREAGWFFRAPITPGDHRPADPFPAVFSDPKEIFAPAQPLVSAKSEPHVRLWPARRTPAGRILWV